MPTKRDPRDGRWRYRFAYEGRRYSGSAPKGHNTQRVAAQLEKAHIERLQKRAYTGVMPTVTDFAKRFLEYQQAHTKPLTFSTNRAHIERHVVPHLGKRKLDEVGRAELAMLSTLWSVQGAAPRTINVRLGTVVRMLGLAEEWGILESVPKAAFVKVPSDVPRFLSDAELRTLLFHASATWRSMVLVGARTGLRIGELRGLQWADIGLGHKPAVHVQRSDPGRCDMDASSPKSNRTRVVPLTADAAECLRELLESARRRRGEKWSPSDWVWPGVDNWHHVKDRNRTRSESGCKAAIDRIAKAAGLADVSWHTLRHTFASALVARGVPLRVVQDLLGHASVKVTERYSHLSPNSTHHSAVATLDLELVDDTKKLPPGGG
jgi:integrase